MLENLTNIQAYNLGFEAGKTSQELAIVFFFTLFAFVAFLLMYIYISNQKLRTFLLKEKLTQKYLEWKRERKLEE